MADVSSADRSGVRRAAWLPLAVAALVVPTVLAGLTLLWPRPQIENELAGTSAAALSTAGLAAGTASLSGRDVTISGLPAADRQRALDAVEAVPGVRIAEFVGSDPATGAGLAGSAGTAAAGPTAAPGLDPAAKQQLQAAIAQALGAAPVSFQPDSAQLTPQGNATVARVLELARPVAAARLQIDGYVAAGPGNGKLSAQQLSDQRAAAVRDALVAGGIPADRITARGLGEGTAATSGHAGRRVEITVV